MNCSVFKFGCRSSVEVSTEPSHGSAQLALPLRNSRDLGLEGSGRLTVRRMLGEGRRTSSSEVNVTGIQELLMSLLRTKNE